MGLTTGCRAIAKYKTYYGIFRRGTKGREREGSRWFWRNKGGKIQGLRG